MVDRRLFVLFAIVFAGGSLLFWVWIRQSPVESTLTLEQQYSRGLVSIANNDPDATRSAIAALDADPDYRDHTRVLRASLALKLGDPAGAIRELAKEPVREQLRVEAALILAEAFYHRHDLFNAEHAANLVVKLDPKNVDGHRCLAAIYYDLGANAAAIKKLNLVASLDTDDFRPHYLLGLIYFDAEKYSTVIPALQAALDRTPPKNQRIDVTLHLAQALLKMHRYQQAADLLDGSSAGNASLLALNSAAHWALGKAEQARRSIRNAERLEPDNRFVLLQKARFAIHDRRFQAAVTSLEKRLSVDAHDTECRYQLALCYRRLGKPDRYQTEYARFKETQHLKRQLSDLSNQAVQQPRNAGIREQIAALYEKIGRPKMAIVYRRAAAACRRFKGTNKVPTTNKK